MTDRESANHAVWARDANCASEKRPAEHRTGCEPSVAQQRVVRGRTVMANDVKRRGCLETLLDVVRTVATVAAVVVAGYAFRVSRESFELNTRALQASQRSWVLYDFQKPPDVDGEHVSLAIRNFGHSPAYGVRTVANVATDCEGAQAWGTVDPPYINPEGPILAPDQWFPVEAMPLGPAGVDVAKPFFVWVGILYTDDYAGAGGRQASFCLRVNMKETAPEKRFRLWTRQNSSK